MANQFVIIPDRLTSILDAVNVLIASLGEAPVSTIDPSPSTDVDLALLNINTADLSVQAKGWHWNTEINYPLTLESDGRVALPNQCLRVTAAYFTPSSVQDIVQRGDYLYDRVNRVYTFDTAPNVDMIVRQPWDYVPQIARSYITLLACQSFHASLQERATLLKVSGSMLNMAMVTLEQHEDAVAKNNSIHDNVSVVSALGGLRRNRSGT